MTDSGSGAGGVGAGGGGGSGRYGSSGTRSVSPSVSGFRTATVSPDARPGPSGAPSHGPVPGPRSSVVYGGMGVNIDIDVNQTIYLDSPEYGVAGYAWWHCSEQDIPTAPTTTAEAAIAEYEVGTCVVNVSVMEYVHINGEISSTETVCLTT